MMKEFDSIPFPEKEFSNGMYLQFRPSEDMIHWMRQTLLNDSSQLYNPTHDHLAHAKLGFLWVNKQAASKDRRVLGTAEKPRSGSKWKAMRSDYQLQQWFGFQPDFVITVDASYFISAGNPERCALLEHELYHCGQKKNEFGMPAFSKQTGLPLFTIRGHDVEEFVGVVERYGAKASGVKELVDAAHDGPLIAEADIEGICGTCLKNVA